MQRGLIGIAAEKIYFYTDGTKGGTLEMKAMLNTTIQCICDLLEDYGEIPDSIMDKLNNEKDLKVLTKWLKLAAESDSIEEFAGKINE